jgi:hypothetical protein
LLLPNAEFVENPLVPIGGREVVVSWTAHNRDIISLLSLNFCKLFINNINRRRILSMTYPSTPGADRRFVQTRQICGDGNENRFLLGAAVKGNIKRRAAAALTSAATALAAAPPAHISLL